MSIILIGGGPVGLANAILFGQRGFEVHVFEKREDIRDQKIGLPPPRTVFYGLSHRGQRALAAAKVQMPQQKGERLGGLTKGGSTSAFGFTPAQWRSGASFPKFPAPGWTWVDRAGLVQHLLRETQRLHPDRIHLHFGQSIHSVDWHKQVATFRSADGTVSSFKYALLVAADGRHSKTRRLYEQHEPSFTSFLSPSPKDYVGFSGLTLPEDMADCVLRDGEGLHLKAWAGTEKMSRILFSENVVGSVTGYLSAERKLLASADTEAEYSDLLDQQFPHLPKSFRRLIAAAVQGQTKQDLGASGRVSCLVGPRFVIMGDAAHAVMPNLGQGCNCGLQDALVFSQVMDQADQDLDVALRLFQEQRHVEVLALHSLDVASSARLGYKGILHPFFIADKFHTKLQLYLAKRRGGTMMDTPAFRMLAGNAPYSQGKAIWERDRNICLFLLALLSAAALSLLMRGASLCMSFV